MQSKRRRWGRPRMQCQALPLELPDLADLWPTVPSPRSRTTAEACGASKQSSALSVGKCSPNSSRHRLRSFQKGPGDSSLVRPHHRLGSADGQSTGWDKYWALHVGSRSAYIWVLGVASSSPLFHHKQIPRGQALLIPPQYPWSETGVGAPKKQPTMLERPVGLSFPTEGTAGSGEISRFGARPAPWWSNALSIQSLLPFPFTVLALVVQVLGLSWGCLIHE